jgi:glycosyltransferase involved in cell wall biosynthesis
LTQLRILAVSMSARPHGIGGMEDHLHTLMEELARRGHEISVITARHPDGVEAETSDGIDWTYIDSGPHWLDPAWAPELERAVRAHLQSRQIDVIHSQASSALPLLRRPFPGLPPVVVSLHGNYLSIVQAAAAAALRRPSPRGLARAGVAIARVSQVHFRQGNWRLFRDSEVSVPSQSQVRPSTWSHLLRPGHVHVVRSGVDTGLFRQRARDEVRRELGLPRDAPVALCIGRLDRGKGADIAIAALARLGEFPTAQLILAGDGPRRAELADLAGRLGLGEHVVFAGRLAAEGVASHLSACDVLVFPTRLAEAGPLVVAQAMATGTPVVASRIGAVPEMLGPDGEAGFLVRPGRPSEVAEALRRLFADPSLRERMGVRGRAHALSEMTIEHMADAMTEVYERALRDTRTDPSGSVLALR